ncbi:MAG TPA: hypothetical protein VFD50_03420 [Thermoleophilia bacterium]|nr:hypothetical protein [Thermoleophilia bacterium]
MNIEVAALELREELNEIAAIEACAACECLLGIAAQALAELRRLPGDEARDAEDDVRRILAAGRAAPHACIECDPCLPVEPYRRFRQALATAVAAGAVAPAAAPLDAAAAGGEAGCGCEGCSGRC